MASQPPTLLLSDTRFGATAPEHPTHVRILETAL